MKITNKYKLHAAKRAAAHEIKEQSQGVGRTPG